MEVNKLLKNAVDYVFEVSQYFWLKLENSGRPTCLVPITVFWIQRADRIFQNPVTQSSLKCEWKLSDYIEPSHVNTTVAFVNVRYGNIISGSHGIGFYAADANFVHILSF